MTLAEKLDVSLMPVRLWENGAENKSGKFEKINLIMPLADK